MNNEHQERRIDYEKFSKVSRRTRKEIDDAIQYSMRSPALPNTVIVLKVMRRKFDNDSGAHFIREDTNLLWPFEQIYESLAKSATQKDDHWVSLLVELERSLLYKKSCTEEEIVDLMEKLFLYMPRQMFSQGKNSPTKETPPLVIKMRPPDLHRREYMAVFLDKEYAQYFSTVEMNVRFELPIVISKFLKSVSFFFNNTEYDRIAIDATPIVSNAVSDEDGLMGFNIVEKIELNVLLEKGILFLTGVDLELMM